MIHPLTAWDRRALRLRQQAANQRADVRRLCIDLMRHAVHGIDLGLVPGLVEIAAEQWVSAAEIEEAIR